MASENVQPLIDQIAATNGVIQSATDFINGSMARIEEAVDAALALGATGEQLEPLRAEIALQTEKAAAVAAAIAANS